MGWEVSPSDIPKDIIGHPYKVLGAVCDQHCLCKSVRIINPTKQLMIRRKQFVGYQLGSSHPWFPVSMQDFVELLVVSVKRSPKHVKTDIATKGDLGFFLLLSRLSCLSPL